MLATLEPIIRQVRNIVLPHYGNVASTCKPKGDHELVTELDVRVENFLREELAKHYPDITFVGEETGGDRTAKKKWLCDPIDGTSYFVRGTPFCTTMLALIEDDRVIFSIIYDFLEDKLYSATRGQGAFCNGQPIHVSTRTLKQSFLACELQPSEDADIALYQRIAKKALCTKLICAGYEFILVATGKMEGRLTLNPFGEDYDFAPGSLLVEEAGGLVANVGSKTYDYRNLRFLATNPVVFRELTEGPDALFPLKAVDVPVTHKVR